MPSSLYGKIQPWFTINEHLSTSVLANTNIDVSKLTAIAFDVDVLLTVGALPTAFSLPAGTPIGIDTSTSVVQTDVGAFMFAMGGK